MKIGINNKMINYGYLYFVLCFVLYCIFLKSGFIVFPNFNFTLRSNLFEKIHTKRMHKYY